MFVCVCVCACICVRIITFISHPLVIATTVAGKLHSGYSPFEVHKLIASSSLSSISSLSHWIIKR